MNRCAAALAGQGLVKGDRLALLSHNCRQFAVLVYATARLGVVLVPINFMLNAEEIAFILDHSGATAFVVEDALAATGEKALAQSSEPASVRAWIGLSGQAPTGDWADLDAWIDGDGDPGEPTCTSPTTTRCASCTPPAPSRGPRASCCPADR